MSNVLFSLFDIVACVLTFVFEIWITVSPTIDEWCDMARGKTAAPFELAARLVLLQCNTMSRLQLMAQRFVVRVLGTTLSAALASLLPVLSAGLCVPDVEESLVQLCGDIGVYFQIRDDYINLADSNYWVSHGFW